MTDARYPERWMHDRRITRLSDRAHRAYVVSLAYGVANRTDGVVHLADLRDLPRYVEDEVPRLTEAGLWEPLDDGTGYRVLDFLETQSSRAELEAADAARIAARKKKAKQRAAAKGGTCPAVPGDVSGDSTGQASARPGQALVEEPPTQAVPDSTTPWPPVATPGPLPVADCDCGWQLTPGQHLQTCHTERKSA